MKVGVVGANGFLGGELIRLMENHSEAELVYLGAGSSAGQSLSQLRPGLAIDMNLEPVDLDEIAGRCETVFLALPHGQSGELAGELNFRGLQVIDLGSDLRLKDRSVSEELYGRPAPSDEVLERAEYCLPELTGKPQATLVSAPGCFATALALGLAPLCGRVSVFGATGSSGSGITPAPGVHHSLRMTNFSAYKPLRHQHRGEVQQLLNQLQIDVQFDFVPHSLPLARGIHLTLLTRNQSCLLDKFSEMYRSNPCIHVQGGPIAMASVIGTNRVEIGVVEEAEASVVFVAIDNLIKGGSGQAIQIWNLMNDWPETLGLPMRALWP